MFRADAGLVSLKALRMPTPARAWQVLCPFDRAAFHTSFNALVVRFFAKTLDVGSTT
jgi:hypothetical protein